MDHISIIVKPTLSCNISCRHCYHTVNERSNEVMSYDTLEKIIRMASEHGSAWFVWHGGEPLLISLSFYKNVIKLQEKYFGKDTHRVSNTIQTNGILIDKKFMNFCRDNKINVGVSFEGPCNDILRERSNEVEKNLRMMKDRGYLFSVSATICNEDAARQREIYRYFRDMGVASSFSPVIKLGSASDDMIPDAETYAEESIKVFDEWIHDTDAEMPLMPHLQYVMSALGEPSASDCAHSSCMMKWLSIYPDGSVYPCAKGCPSEFRMGNVNDLERLSDAFRSDAFRELLSATVERRERCSSCEIFRYCNGGCSIDALSEGSMSMNGGTSCRIFKILFTHILNTVNNILKERPDLSSYNKFIREAILGKLINPNVISV